MPDLFPILKDLKTYSPDKFRGDAVAGITIGVMLIPQGMAYAMIAGLPPVYGLYAAIFPQLMYALLGTSRQLAVGPVAMDSLIVATGVSMLAVAQSENYIALAILLAFMMGGIQLLMGAFRLGFVVNFLSRPVVNGFTYAAALVISISQLQHLTGISLPSNAPTHLSVRELVLRIGELHYPTLTLGIFGILLIIGLKKWHKMIPGALIAVVLSTLATQYGHLHTLGVKIVGDIPSGIPAFAFPEVPDVHTLTELLPVAFTLALIGFMEAFSIAKAIENNHKEEYRVDANRELIALGAGNIFGSLFSSFPTSGGFSRSAVSESTGANTSMASYISAFIVLITVLFFTPMLYFLPKAILASIILVAVLGLIDIKQCLHLWHTDRRDFYMMAATFLGTLLIGIKEGIAIGVGLSLLMVIYETTQPHMAVLGQIPGTTFFKNIKRFREAEEIAGALIIRFDSRLYFANAGYFKTHIEQELRKRSNIRLLVIDAQSISSIDSSGIATLRELHDQCQALQITLAFTSVIGPVRDTFVKAGFVEQLGKEHCFEEIEEAIAAFVHPDTNDSPHRLKFQSNLDQDSPPL